MSGNVWEWCSDYYGQYPSDKQTNPTGAKKGTARIVRGGCYAAIGRQCRVASRKSLYQGGKDYMTGFRLAMDDDREARAAAAAQQAEQERIAAEKAAADAAKQAEQDRIAAEKKAEQDRIVEEKKAEQDRIAAEKAAEAAAKQAEQERIAAEKKAEQDRIAAEKAAETAAKQAEQDRIAAEKKAEQDRIVEEKKARQNRINAEKSAEQQQLTEDRRNRQEEQQRRAQHRRDSINALPWNTFFTVNTAISPIPQFSYGFKVGQVKVLGWYFSAMTNFHFKGAFNPLEENKYYVLTGKQRATKFSALAGLVVRPCQPLSIHIGAGFGYRALTLETETGWYNLPKRTYYGVDASLGIMLHFKGVAISAEAVYTTCDFNHSEIKPLSRLEGKLGIGFFLPNKR